MQKPPQMFSDRSSPDCALGTMLHQLGGGGGQTRASVPVTSVGDQDVAQY